MEPNKNINRFYQPSIEEFYVGFEYEIGILEIDAVNLKQGETVGDYIKNIELGILNAPYKLSWHKSIFEQYDIFDITSSLIVKNRIRVKYLDKDDIEDCGFTGQSANKTYYKRDGYRLTYWPNEPIWLTSIYKVYGIDDEIKIFDGTIKNKSELKMILKMLNIK